MKRAKPVFRFVGEPRPGVRAQLEIALAVQSFFFSVTEKGLDRAAIEQELGKELSDLKAQMRVLEVEVSGPAWFAELFRS
ncbi:MAG: hypothetical protein HYW90_03065 [Candidatus Sungbacteria bacterium]|nr:hypothetical protein [Candidatus Sungbacteria bacterium]